MVLFLIVAVLGWGAGAVKSNSQINKAREEFNNSWKNSSFEDFVYNPDLSNQKCHKRILLIRFTKWMLDL
jgi:hypothetical protein